MRKKKKASATLQLRIYTKLTRLEIDEIGKQIDLEASTQQIIELWLQGNTSEQIIQQLK